MKEMLSLNLMKTLVLETILLGICMVGDYLLKNPFSRVRAVIAVTDSLTHGLVGLVSWSIVCDIKARPTEVWECILCLVLAVIVDVDHFIAAKSFSLQAAVSLPSRPPFHATSLIFLIDTVLLVVSFILGIRDFQLLSMILTVAWLSHHIRDAVRRGLWFYPLGETPPLPSELYLGLIACLPLAMKVVYDLWLLPSKRLANGDNVNIV